MLKVLVVDDSPVMRSMVARSLQLSGVDVAKVHQAGNGHEALEILHAEWIDIMLCDVNMPTMGGLELVERMAAKGSGVRVPVVMISSLRDAACAARLKQLGVSAYLEKPFRPEALGRAIERALGLSEAR
jgi:two-component system chemotaxis response regulator CheY